MTNTYTIWNSVTTALTSPMTGCTTSSSANTPKTILQLAAPPNKQLEIVQWGILIPTPPAGTIQIECLDTGASAATGTWCNVNNWNNPVGINTAALVGMTQIVSLGSPTAGTFTLTFNGQTTTAIAYNATASTVQSALAALSTIGTGNVTVTLSGTTYTITLGGTLLSPQPAFTLTSSLTGGTPVISTQQTCYNATAEGSITATRLLGQSTSPADFHMQYPLDERPVIAAGDIARVRAVSSVASVQLLAYLSYN